MIVKYTSFSKDKMSSPSNERTKERPLSNHKNKIKMRSSQQNRIPAKNQASYTPLYSEQAN